MRSGNQVARVAFVVAGAIALGSAAPEAGAQRSVPRPAVGTTPPPSRNDQGMRPRRDDEWDRQSRPRRPFSPPVTVVYLPSDGPTGYLDPQQSVVAYQQGVYYAPGGSVAAYDSYGRLVSSGVGTLVPSSMPAYTPDLSGSPYVVTGSGVMIVDLPGGERRTVPSCAAVRASHDPDGRARTVFYQPMEYGLVLRDGQRGRVQGTLPSGATACYGIDALGRVALQY